MPEVHFYLEWPDGELMQCYSPSTVVREHFRAGMVLTVSELVDESKRALARASDRVRTVYGYSCTSAAAELQKILERAGAFQGQEEVKVVEVT